MIQLFPHQKQVLTDPTAHIKNRRVSIDYLGERLLAAQERKTASCKQIFIKLASKLDAMSPLRVLSRGYAIASNEQGETVKSVVTLNAGDRIKVNFSDGSADCTVESLCHNN